MKSGTTSEVAPGVVIFGIVTLRTGSRPVDWSFNSPHVGPYISVEGERPETIMMEIASEIGDPRLARLVHPVESITMSTTDGTDFESIYLTMLFEEQRLEEVVDRMWVAFRSSWEGDAP